MSAKKESIEEKLSQSIFYNISILKMAVKTTSEFDENLSRVRIFWFRNFIKELKSFEWL